MLQSLKVGLEVITIKNSFIAQRKKEVTKYNHITFSYTVSDLIHIQLYSVQLYLGPISCDLVKLQLNQGCLFINLFLYVPQYVHILYSLSLTNWMVILKRYSL